MSKPFSKWSFSFVDLDKVQGQPEYIFSLKQDEHWFVCSSAINANHGPFDGPGWVIVNSGDAVRIPLFPYCTFDRDPAIALAMAFQLGSSVMLTIDDNTYERMQSAHLAIGVPLQELDDYSPILDGKVKVNCFRFWIGVALKLGKQRDQE